MSGCPGTAEAGQDRDDGHGRSATGGASSPTVREEGQEELGLTWLLSASVWLFSGEWTPAAPVWVSWAPRSQNRAAVHRSILIKAFKTLKINFP